MHNVVYLIGRLVEVPTIIENKGVANLAVQRSFKNEEGIYETDIFKLELFSGSAEKVIEYCHKGDLLGIKGYLKNYNKEINGNKYQFTKIIVEKVSFLASKRED